MLNSDSLFKSAAFQGSAASSTAQKSLKSAVFYQTKAQRVI